MFYLVWANIYTYINYVKICVGFLDNLDVSGVGILSLEDTETTINDAIRKLFISNYIPI